MIKPRILPECHQCQMYAQSNYLVCAIHPVGYAGESCPDFAQIPGLSDTPEWIPVGLTYYGGELMRDPMSDLSTEDRLWMLEHHPFFTRVCPQCGADYQESPDVHWDCPACGWLDDSV